MVQGIAAHYITFYVITFYLFTSIKKYMQMVDLGV